MYPSGSNIDSLPTDIILYILSMVLDVSDIKHFLIAIKNDNLYNDLWALLISNELPCRAKNIVNMPLPKGLRELSIHNKEISKIPSNLPNTIEKLDLNKCKRLRELPSELPNTLKILCIRKCERLWTLPNSFSKLENLVEFDCTGCENMHDIEKLPPYLKVLKCNCCHGFECLSCVSSSRSLQYLSVEFCQSLSEIPDLPSTLIYFSCKFCENIESISTTLSSCSLQYFSCSNCYNLDILPELPSTLKSFDCSYSAIKRLPKLPSMLKTFNCCSCRQLENIPEIPRSVEHLTLESPPPSP